ncbi:MAG: hypothetical protein HY059_09365 [Proteobacteria bacterium]|nr:hypothetical protein [Pseudomonadota bacterium]
MNRRMTALAAVLIGCGMARVEARELGQGLLDGAGQMTPHLAPHMTPEAPVVGAASEVVMISRAPSASSVWTMRQIKEAEREISYPVFTPLAGAGYAAINATVAAEVEGLRCEPGRGSTTGEYKVLAATPRFVSIRGEVHFSGCAAHDSSTAVPMLFDARTGARVHTIEEFGGVRPELEWGPGDEEKSKEYHQKMAGFVVQFMPSGARACLRQGGVRDRTLWGELSRSDIRISLKARSVLIDVMPSPVHRGCAFTAEAPYRAVRTLINPGSVLHGWLQ